ncbi:MAG: asparagine--tRNA ligase [Nitrososphaerales archaeon]
MSQVEISEAFQLPEGSAVKLRGWVASKSEVGGIIFITLRDGTGYIQAAGKKGVIGEEDFQRLKRVTKETAVELEGSIRVDKRAPKGREVAIKSLSIIALADKWPITKSAVKSTSFLYDYRHLSIRGRKASAVIKIRWGIMKAAIEFFSQRGYCLISSPTIVQSACEGGATLFELDYFGQKAYLSQSAQFYEEAAICALGKVFILQPAFRAEKSKTPKHLTEFWMIEAEKAFMDQEENMKLQEDLITYICNRVVEDCKEELEVLGRRFKPPEPPFPRITYDEVLKFASEQNLGFKWGEDIPTVVETLLSKSQTKPFFITDYPLSARSFYHMTKPDNENITLSADLIAPEGHGEIATGGQRIHDYQTLLKRIESQELPMENFRWYLELRRYGMPPHSGFGVGVERLTKWVAGLKHIRAASLFPRTPTRVNP